MRTAHRVNLRNKVHRLLQNTEGTVRRGGVYALHNRSMLMVIEQQRVRAAHKARAHPARYLSDLRQSGNHAKRAFPSWCGL